MGKPRSGKRPKYPTEKAATAAMARLSREMDAVLSRYPEVHVAAVYGAVIAEGSGEDLATITHCEGEGALLAQLLVNAFPSLGAKPDPSWAGRPPLTRRDN